MQLQDLTAKIGQLTPANLAALTTVVNAVARSERDPDGLPTDNDSKYWDGCYCGQFSCPECAA